MLKKSHALKVISASTANVTDQDVIPYSRKLLKEITFVNFIVLWLFVKFLSMKFGGRGVLWHGMSEQSTKVFSAKIVVFPHSQKFFSLASFPLYSNLKT